MVYKGLLDENGVVCPVQGAGTTYNEELNSLAIGKGTSAIGVDQFVFGRSNKEDSNKVEIVGGGTFIDIPILDITSALIVEKNEHSTEYYIGGGFDAINDFLLGKQAKLEVEELPLDYTISDIWLYNMREYDGYIRGYGLVMKDGVTLSGNNISYKPWGSDNKRYENNVTIFHRFTVGKKIEKINSIVPRSIRTLDWDGNQWNAGDLTCDDGEGNVISLRELAKKEGNYDDSELRALINNKVEIYGESSIGNIVIFGSNGTIKDSETIPSDFAKEEHTHEIDDVVNLWDELNSKMDTPKEIYLDCDSGAWEVTPTNEGEMAFKNALVYSDEPKLVIVNVHIYEGGVENSSVRYRTIGSMYGVKTQTNSDSYDLEAFIVVNGKLLKRTGQEDYQEITWGQGLSVKVL